MPEKTLSNIMAEVGPGGLYASIAGLVNYAWHSLNGKPFRFMAFVTNGCIAGWLGMNVALFMEPGNLQLFMASMCGFCSMPILAFIEKDGWKLIIEAFKRTFNLQQSKKDE